MTAPPGLNEALRRLAAAFEAVDARYAVGGAVAMAFAGRIRATRDIDVLAVVESLRAAEFSERLGASGFSGPDAAPIDARALAEAAKGAGLARVYFGDITVDLFTPKVPLQDSILVRRRKVDADGTALWVTSPEDLILIKMVFHRPKDLDDVRHLLAANEGALDLGYIESWMPKTLEPAAARELAGLLRPPAG